MPYARTTLQDMRHKRRKLGEDMRALVDKAQSEKRDLTTEENAQFDAMHSDGEELRKKIEREEKIAGYVQDEPSRREAVVDPSTDPKADKSPTTDVEEPEGGEAEAERALRNAGRGVRDTPEYRQLFRRFLGANNAHEANAILTRAMELRIEKRDLSVDNELQAGVLVPPEQFVAELLKDMDDEQIIRQYARKFVVPTAKSLGAPKRTSKASTWARGAEVATPAADSALAFGKRQLFPKHASGEIKVSRDFLRSNLMGGEQIVREELARDGGEMLEQEFFTGSGTGLEALGLFTASVEGISTGRDVATGNTTTAVTLDGLTEAKYAIKAGYWPRLRWIGSRTFHKQLYGIRDGMGRPIFVESYKVGEPDVCLGFPVHISEFAPATFTTGQYVAILGDLYYYWIADALDIEIQRLDELYARSNQVGFIGRLKNDAMPVLEECFSRVKLA